MNRFSPTYDSQDVAEAVAFELERAGYAALTADESEDREPAPWSAAWLEHHRAAMREADELDLLKDTVCRAGYNAVLDAPTLRDAAEAMRAHYVSCSRCGSDIRIVADDRLHLGKTNASCCEGKAA